MNLDERAARDIVDAAQIAWSRRDVAGVLAQYADDVTFWSNVGGADGEPLTITGKAALAQLVQSLADTLESTSVMEHFSFADGVGRANIAYYIRHKKTGLILSGSFRQITTLRNGKISRVEQYHDAARTAAFWRLVAELTEGS